MLKTEQSNLGARSRVNTHGGLLSHCHPGNPGSMFALTEAVIQLRHQAGERQVRMQKWHLYMVKVELCRVTLHLFLVGRRINGRSFTKKFSSTY